MVAVTYFRLILFSLLFFLANHVLLSMDNVKSELTLQEAHSLYINKNLTIIDVRTINEWKMTGIIPTSILINMHDDKYQERNGFVTEITKILLEYQDKNVAFICASGARSKIITDYLVNKGYKNIYHIPDGIMGKQNDGWLFNGYPLINYNNMKEK